MKKMTISCIAYLIYLNLIFSGINIAHAETFSGGFSTGKLTYAIGNGGNSTIANTAASKWNGVSPKVKLTYSSATSTYGSTANIITYCDSDNSPTSGALGITYPYKSWTGTSATSATPNEKWVKAIIYQYKTPYLNSSEKRIATATHELGHALSIAHPPASNTTAVMRQGVKNSYNLTSYDTSNLKSKWGNWPKECK